MRGEHVGGMSLGGCKGQATRGLKVKIKTLDSVPCRWTAFVSFNLEAGVGVIRDSL